MGSPLCSPFKSYLELSTILLWNGNRERERVGDYRAFSPSFADMNEWEMSQGKVKGFQMFNRIYSISLS
jgi:hypothetical protein